MKMIDRQGAVQDIPDDQAQAAFQSGKYGFVGDDTIPIQAPSGRMGRIRPDQAADAFAKGSRVLGADEVHKAVVEEKYGSDIGHEAAAGGEAVARGLFGGFADKAAIEGARALGGKSYADAVREHLAGEKEANPWVSRIGEVAGTIAPFLAGGEAVEAPRVAELARSGVEALEGGTEAAKALGAGDEAAAASRALGEAKTLPAAGVNPAAELKTAAASPGANAAAAEAAKAAEAEQAAKAGEAVVDIGETGKVTPEAADAIEEAAAGPSKFGSAMHGAGSVARSIGVIPRAVAEAGELTAKGLTNLLGREGAGTIEKAAVKILARGAAAGLEGGIFGLQDELDEEALGDEKLNATKLRAAFGHGALMGAGTGGLLTLGGELSREIAGRSAPFMKKMAGYLGWRSINPTKGMTMKAVRYGGGAAVAQEALDAGIFNGASTVKELLEKTEQAVDQQVEVLKKIYGGSKSQVPVKEIMAIWEAEIAELKKKALHGGIVDSLERGKADFLAKLTGQAADEAAAAHVPISAPGPKGPVTQEELQELFKKGGGPAILSVPEALEKLGYRMDWKKAVGGDVLKGLERIESVPINVKPTAESVGKSVEDMKVPIAELIRQRQAVQDMAFREAKANDPGLRVQHLRAISSKLSNLENTELGRAEHEIPGLDKAVIKRAKEKYARLAHFKETLQRTNAAYQTNNFMGPTEYGAAILGMMSGHTPVAVLAALGRKFWKSHGKAVAARYVDKLATLSAIDRATSMVDREVSRGVNGFFRPGERVTPRLRARVYTGTGKKNDYQARVDAVTKAQAFNGEHAATVGEIASAFDHHAPKTASEFQRGALATTAWLATQIPSGHIPTNSLQPNLKKPRVSTMEQEAFNRKFDIAHDPIGVVFDRLNENRLTTQDVNTLENTHPELLPYIRQEMIDELSKQGEELEYPKRIQLSILLEMPEATLDPRFIQQMQSGYEPEKPPPQVQGASAPKRKIEKLANQVSLSGGLSAAAGTSD